MTTPLHNILGIPDKGRAPVLLAPMAGVTDLPFRVICRAHGADFSYTEMVSAKGLAFKNRNTEELMTVADEERPTGIQLFGSDPATVGRMAAEVAERDGISVIDINMGCPARKITGNSDGCALMLDPVRAGQVIEAAARASRLPVTVKFRKGWDDEHVNCVEFARMAESSGAAAITVHGRTREQMYSGSADLDAIAAVAAAVSIPVIGNGDITDVASAIRMLETGCKGLMVGRAADGDPFIFGELSAALDGRGYTPPTKEARIDAAIGHLHAHAEYYGGYALSMRARLARYIKGMPGASKLRPALYAAADEAAMTRLLRDYLESIS